MRDIKKNSRKKFIKMSFLREFVAQCGEIAFLNLAQMVSRKGYPIGFVRERSHSKISAF